MLLLLSSLNEEAVKSETMDLLITKTAQGDTEAFEKLYTLTRASVYGYAMSVVKHPQDAEDITHDCFVNLYRAAANYTSCGKPMAWILTIAKNLCYKRLNMRNRNMQLTDDEWENAFSSNELMGHEEIMTIRKLIELLNDDERSIIILHAVSGLKFKDIARFTDLPTSTVLSKYYRGIAKLKKFYFEQ